MVKPSPAQALDCTPGEAVSECVAARCSDGSICAAGHKYCEWKETGNEESATCTNEVDNCNTQCVNPTPFISEFNTSNACLSHERVKRQLLDRCIEGYINLNFECNDGSYELQGTSTTCSTPDICRTHQGLNTRIADSCNNGKIYRNYLCNDGGTDGYQTDEPCSGSGNQTQPTPTPAAPDTTPPTTTAAYNSQNGIALGQSVTVTFNATDQEGSGIRYIHTAIWPNVKNQTEVEAAKARGNRGDYQRISGSNGQRTAVVPFYVEYRAEDIKGNKGATKTLFVTAQPRPRTSASSSPAPRPRADINGNGCIGREDFDAWLTAFKSQDLTTNTSVDVDGNGKVDLLDYNLWYKAFTTGTNRCTTK